MHYSPRINPMYEFGRLEERRRKYEIMLEEVKRTIEGVNISKAVQEIQDGISEYLRKNTPPDLPKNIEEIEKSFESVNISKAVQELEDNILNNIKKTPADR